MTSLGAFLLIQILGTVLSDPDWAFQERIDGVLGPREWYKGYELCGGTEQSPVNLREQDLQGRWDFTEEYRKIQSEEIHLSNATLTNNGLYLALKSDDMSEVALLIRSERYPLAEIRFHWGRNYKVGSDNKFDGESFPMMMQFIFYDIRGLKSYEESLRRGYGLYIIAVEFKLSFEDNEVMAEVVDALNSIQKVGATKVIEKMEHSLEQFFPTTGKSYYFYYGSMTSPPCAAAFWLLYMDTQTISPEQLEKFRQLDSKYGGKITNTDRPVQPLNGRTVFFAYAK